MTKHCIVTVPDGDVLVGFSTDGKPRWRTPSGPFVSSEAVAYSTEDLGHVAIPALEKADVYTYSLWPAPSPYDAAASGDPMSNEPKRHCIPDPFPENIGVTALTIFAPEGFRGDVEVLWWYPGKSDDADRQRMTCSCAWLLQGVFHDVRGSRPREDLLGSGAAASFDARIVALVLHAFYRARIEAAARLEAAYQWQSYPRQGK